ncbi:phosphoribosylglycinamide formyltransferase [Corynebacterium pyruviciproducens ATCC BAA-1742]|uniref:Phosphoribosylglycinamide formyltransferase n=1 Tax=Corynebacterium pyruviciproducens ATCC BAA-1742 TaxID=1125779 RepID=S2ZMA5_9CORY|nr:phosphoribosylglycinamide formyltransferase [Corynebacterium pyruviciproducens ATCC BAA-1742]
MVLASGTGTLLQALIDRSSKAYSIAAVITDRPCEAVDRAARAGIPYQVVTLTADDRDGWNRALRDAVAAYSPDVVVSAGFMRIVSADFLSAFDVVLNTHPALLPAFKGAHAVRDALAYGVKVTGSTVHKMDAGMDTGPIVAQWPVTISEGDDEATLHERIKIVERQLIVKVLEEGLWRDRK